MKTDTVTFGIVHEKRWYSVDFRRCKGGWSMATRLGMIEYSRGPKQALRPSMDRAERFLKFCLGAVAADTQAALEDQPAGG